MSMNNNVTRREFLVLGAAVAALAGVGTLHPLYAAETTAPAKLPALGQGFDADRRAIRRSLGLRDGLAYLNCGSLGPIPQYTRDKVLEASRQLEEDPTNQGYGALLEVTEQARRMAATFLGSTLDEMAVTQCTTEGMNAIAQGLTLQQGDHILTTDHEHPGGRMCWDYYVRKSGIVIDTVALPLTPKNKQEIMQAFAQKMTDRTRVISASHVLFTTGLKLPILELADLAHAHGALLVVDGAQAPAGNVVDLKALKCDAYATSAHKWLLAPKGTGLLHVSAAARKQIDPILLQAGMGTYTAATGTRNLPGIIGLGAAIELLNTVGKETVANYAMKLRNALYKEALTLPRVTIASPEPGELATPILTLAFPKEVSNETITQRLREQYKIIVKCVPSNYVNGIRISMHIYTVEEDLARLTSALRKELA